MEQKWTVYGALGEWTMTVALEPETEQNIDKTAVRRAFGRFDSLDCHFYDIVNLAEALEFTRR